MVQLRGVLLGRLMESTRQCQGGDREGTRYLAASVMLIGNWRDRGFDPGAYEMC